MKRQAKWMFLGVCAMLVTGVFAGAAGAQDKMEVKEKPVMYSYVANWDVPRNMWKEIEKPNAADDATMSKMLADGTIVAYGSDVNLVHQEGQATHDDWWSAMSMANLMKVLTAVRPSGVDNPVYSASKHFDNIWESRYYNWRSGSFTNGYTRVAVWRMRKDAPSDAFERLSKRFLVPLMEKLLASGAIYEYEIDEQAIHSDAPGEFIVVVIGNGPESFDKFNAALHEASEGSPVGAGAWLDRASHRDELFMTRASYK